MALVVDKGRVDFYAKIARVQIKLSRVPLDGMMSINGMEIAYPTKNNIVDIVKSALYEEEMVCIPSSLRVERSTVSHRKDKLGVEWDETETVIEEIFTMMDLSSGYSEDYTWISSCKGKTGKEITVASATAIKNFYLHFFNITTEKDFEGDEHLINTAVHKMDMESLRQVLYTKAIHGLNKATMVKVQALAKKNGQTPMTWTPTDMDMQDLALVISLSMDVLAPSKAGAALDDAVDKIGGDNASIGNPGLNKV